MLKITIPSPCHENWDNMSPNQQGRHCNSCSKTVVDFTQMKDDEVKNFLINKQHERLCGRFSSTQLQQISIELPQNIFQLQLPFWKRFLVASLLVFSTTLFSCEVNTKGEVVTPGNNSAAGVMIVSKADTLPTVRMMGEAAVIKPVKCNPITDTTSEVMTGNVSMGIVAPEPPTHALMGDIAIVPQKDTIPECNVRKGEVRMVQPKDTVVKKNDEPVIMGKMIAVPQKPIIK
ncbi:MAG: hypothetical protein ABI402_08905 [Ferruginibacter sp.]